jgi:hypothetical protein
MTRSILGALLTLLVFGSRTEAQGFGYGATPEGDYLRGVGAAAYGMGTYNLRTAQANSINTETAIRWNDYVANCVKTSAREHHERLVEDLAKRKEAYDKLHERFRTSPEDLDVLKGDALNAVLKQLLSPTISESSFRYAEVKLPADVVRQIPFFLADEKVKFSMSRLKMRSKAKGPVAFQDPRFARHLRSYEVALDEALEQAMDGRMTLEAIDALRATVDDLARKLDREIPPSTDAYYIEAKQRVEELRESVDLLKKHKVQMAIAELDKYSGTTVNDLRRFMQKHNLLFAPSKTPDERTLYPRIHTELLVQREKLKGAIDVPEK